MESPYPALVIFLMVKVTVFQPLGYDLEARGTILNDCMYPHHRVFSVYARGYGSPIQPDGKQHIRYNQLS